MKFRLLVLVVIALVLVSCKEQKPKIETAADESIVYFCKDITPENILKLYEALGVKQEGKIGLKVHFGEEGNQNFLNPELLRPLVEKVNPTFVETNVLYVGKRRYTDSHIALAKEHGFTFAPIDILDDEGETEIPAEGLKHYTKVKTGSHFNNYDNYIIYSHFKGHGSAGFGGAIKNVSMGLASPGGKMAMHATNFPTTVDPEACVNCQRCVGQCPAKAITITENGPVIDTTKCIGCAKCIAECPLKIFKPDCAINWNQQGHRVVDFIRGLSPYPAATMLMEDDKGQEQSFKVFQASFQSDANSAVGQLVTEKKSVLKIGVKDGFLHVLSLQLSGKKRITAEEFLRGYDVKNWRIIV